MPTRSLSAALAIAALAAAPAWAGSRFDLVTTTPDGTVTETSEIKADDGKLTMKMVGGDPQTEDMRMIFRGDLDPPVMYVIDDGQQSYMTMDSQQISDTMADVQSQMQAAMAQAMQNMTPEQAAQLQAMMGAQGGGAPGMGAPGMGGMMGMPAAPTIDVRPTGQTQTVNGINTAGFEVLVNGTRSTVIWAAPIGSLSGGEDLASAFEGMQAFMADMPFAGDSAAIYDIAALDGRVPVRTDEYENGVLTAITTIGQGESASFPASDFEPDPTYTQQSMFGGL